MSDNLRLFNSEYKGVTGFKATTTSGLTQTYLPATDYLTKATQTLTDAEQTQVWENLGIQDLFDHSEPTSTALYAHTVGQTFVFGTQLVKCTSDIAIGGTITMGTNVTEYPINLAINEFRLYNILRKAIDIIPDNADLNNCWQPGVWEIPSGSNAETMTNVPTTRGGAKLITIAATAENMYSSQFYLTTYGELWHRYKRNETDTPSTWQKMPRYDEVTPAGHDIIPLATDIPEGGDLDDYWTPGVWRIISGARAETISNVPNTGGGAKLITITLTAEEYYSMQLYFMNGVGVNVYARYRGGGTTISDWVQFTHQGIITANSINAVAYTSQSLTSAQQNQTLTNLGLTSDLKAAASVSVANFFSTNPLSSATYDIRKSGKVVSFYAYFASAPSNGTIKSGYRPCGGTSGHYMILPLLSKSSPYTPVGSVWINGSGAVSFYGASSGGYVSGTWVCT